MNKKADSKLLSIWWFAVLTVIAGGVITGVLIFQSAKIDVRIAEADILSSKIISCVLVNDYFNAEFISGKMDIFSSCGLSKKIIIDSKNYYLKLHLTDSLGKDIFSEQKYGNNALEADCRIQQALFSAQNFARCSELTISGLDSSGRLLNFNILVASNKEFRLEAAK